MIIIYDNDSLRKAEKLVLLISMMLIIRFSQSPYYYY